MAAAIIPIVAAAIGALGPQRITSIVQFVESLFGHSSDTGKQNGADKLQTAVTLLQNALAALANAGKIPSAAAVDPSLPAGLAGAIQQAFDALKAAGLLGASAAPIPAILPSLPAPVPALGGKSITITGVLYGG
jgi:predicted anti-sigma-YlaC factor YlaD